MDPRADPFGVCVFFTDSSAKTASWAVVPLNFSTPTSTTCPVVCTFPCARIWLNPEAELPTTLRN